MNRPAYPSQLLVALPLALVCECASAATVWLDELDANSDFFGSYEDLEAQARGEAVWPRLE